MQKMWKRTEIFNFNTKPNLALYFYVLKFVFVKIEKMKKIIKTPFIWKPNTPCGTKSNAASQNPQRKNGLNAII